MVLISLSITWLLGDTNASVMGDVQIIGLKLGTIQNRYHGSLILV